MHHILLKDRKSGKDKEESSGNIVVVNIYNHCVPPSREFIMQQKDLLLNVLFSRRGIMKMETIHKFTLKSLTESLSVQQSKVCITPYRYIQVYTLEVCFLGTLHSLLCNAAPAVCIPAQTSYPRSHMRCAYAVQRNAPRIWLQNENQCSRINTMVCSSCQPFLDTASTTSRYKAIWEEHTGFRS